MRRCCSSNLMAGMLLTIAVCSSFGDESRLALPVTSRASAIPPLLDDAGLHDVQMLGELQGWAVGDRGVIWQTSDGGQQWQLVPSPVDVELRGICFLTDRVGWVVGGSVRRGGQETSGVVLHTTDGGATWQESDDDALPFLHGVQFFDLEQGVAVGESNATYPTGVMTTNDGGKTWHAVSGKATNGWRSLACYDSENGFVAGSMGRYTTMAGGELQEAFAGASGLRGVSDVTIATDMRGWLVGDGGLLLKTENAGISWNQAEGDVPRVLRDVMDFRAVAAIGDSVWIAGQPGSVVWHSNDDGKTWTGQPTGHTAPIESLAFSSATHGVAVGALGCILQTSDGGATWKSVRGSNRRAALLAIHAHENHVSLNLTTKYAGELGYRTVTTVTARRDVGPDANDGRLLDLRLHEAVTTAGGNSGAVDWAFPIAAPGLDRDQTELVREWQMLTDNHLRETMLARLACELSTWRPDVIVIDDPARDDAATTLLFDAVRLAVQQAADPNQHAELRAELQLPAWEVKRMFRRLPPGSEGPVRLDAYEFLPRYGKALSMAAVESYQQLSPNNVTKGQRETYVTVPLKTPDESDEQTPRDFFAGLILMPGGEARRELTSINDDILADAQRLAQQQRNFASYASRMLDDQRQAAQLVAQTADIIGGAPDDQAAAQLFNLADEYRERGDWENAEAVLVELTERYPDEPTTIEAMEWLLRLWSSEEVCWQRLRNSTSVQKSRFESDDPIKPATLVEEIETNPEPVIQQTSVGGQVMIGGAADQNTVRREQWQQGASHMSDLLRKHADGAVISPAIQFLFASMARRQNQARAADEIYRRFINETSGGPWNNVAVGELWLTQPTTVGPDAVVRCSRAGTPPVLDGSFDDPCWMQSSVVQLKNEAEHRQTKQPFVDENVDAHRAAVRLAYDARFLYVAASIPRDPSLPSDKPHLPGRTHDADLSEYDRLNFAFDVDRDYTTFYQIDVDQRGWTFDACWENAGWNSQRYIAAISDDREWRIEIAIPFDELVPEAPASGETWAAAITRIMPTIGVESWSSPSGSHPRPEGFGLLHFE